MEGKRGMRSGKKGTRIFNREALSNRIQPPRGLKAWKPGRNHGAARQLSNDEVDFGRLPSITYVDVAKHGITKRTQTISIVEFSFKDILLWYQKDEKFREAMDSGRYVYYDKRLVLKRKEAFTRGRSNVVLAKYNPLFDRLYCLRIEKKSILAGPRVPHGTLPYGVLSFRYTVINAAAYEDTTEIDIAEFEKFWKERIGNGPGDEIPMDTFGKTLTRYMKLKKCTIEKLSELTGITEKTIERYRLDQTSPRLDYVVAICIALRLHPFWSSVLVRLAGYSLTGSVVHSMYGFLLDTGYRNGDVALCNHFLRSRNLKPLTKKM